MNIDNINELLIRVIEGWNVFGLPALLVFLAVLSARNSSGDAEREGQKTVALLGRVHLALAFWSLTTIVSELWAYRAMGIFPTNPITGLFGSTIMMIADLLIALGLLRRWRLIRWLAIFWSLFRTALAVFVAVWFWQYSHRIDWTEWPRDLLYWGFPPFEIVVLLMPSTSRVFRKTPLEDVPTSEPRFPLLSTCVLVFLAVALSAGLTDAVDWSVRTIAEAYLEA